MDVNMALLFQKITIIPVKENDKMNNQSSLFSCLELLYNTKYKCPLPENYLKLLPVF